MVRAALWLWLLGAARCLATQRAAAGAGQMGGPLPPPREAVTMKTWASLKEAMDKIGSEVRQVLLVRSDIAMLQEDLHGQEELWRKAEADLNSELDALRVRAGRVKQKVDEGAHIRLEVKGLQERIKAEQGEAYRLKLEFEHARDEAALDERRLGARLFTLRQQLETAEAERKKEVEAALREEASAKETTSDLERQLAQLRDHLSELKAQQEVEENSGAARTRSFRGQLADAKATLSRLRSQVVPKSQVEAQVAFMRHQLDQETKQMVQVQTAQTQLAAACDERLQQAKQAVAEARRQAGARRQEMLPVCDAARQQQRLLQSMVAQSCGSAPSPATAL